MAGACLHTALDGSIVAEVTMAVVAALKLACTRIAALRISEDQINKGISKTSTVSFSLPS